MGLPFRRALFHGTFVDLVEDIEEEGLIPSRGPKIWEESEKGYIYLADTADLASEWVTGAYEEARLPSEWNDPGGVIYAIDMECLDREKLEVDPNIGGARNYRYRGKIPPDCIVEINRWYFLDGP